MKFYSAVVKSLPANAMALYPFIFFKTEEKKQDLILINHEKIHLRQQIELLVIPFYILYLSNYLINLIRYKNHDLAYFNIAFEKEAYHFERDLGYLPKRELFSWVSFMK